MQRRPDLKHINNTKKGFQKLGSCCEGSECPYPHDPPAGCGEVSVCSDGVISGQVKRDRFGKIGYFVRGQEFSLGRVLKSVMIGINTDALFLPVPDADEWILGAGASGDVAGEETRASRSGTNFPALVSGGGIVRPSECRSSA